MQHLTKEIEIYCQEISQEFDQISDERKVKLVSLAEYISRKIKDNQEAKLVVICTHNSRRSHIGQIWLSVAADYFQLPTIQSFSGGTEATAFNIRAVRAFRRIGFKILEKEQSEPKQCEKGNNDVKHDDENPIYQIEWSDGMRPYEAFSKKYDGHPNPSENFAAILVCSQADEGCPVVIGCDFRLFLPYDDPKQYDDSALEESKYDERVRDIGREIFFSFSQVKFLQPPTPSH